MSDVAMAEGPVAPLVTTTTSSPQIQVPDIAANHISRVKYINLEAPNIKILAVQYPKKAVHPTDRPDKLEIFLAWLDTSLDMTSEIKNATHIDRYLPLIVDLNKQFPQHFVDKAKALLNKWEGENWGQDLLVDDSEEEDVESPISPTQPQPFRQPRASSTGETTLLRLPPRDHPIFGERGIMHGVVTTTNKRRNYRTNINYTPRNAKVFGNNGLKVGQWWPMQMVALFNGAHGARQGGISGSKDLGAYSIVISGTYDDLDQDKGNAVYYSGSRSHENTDPNFAGDSSGATQALKKSLASGQPVRVLRSASGKSHYAPSCGLRYDGLYRVVRMFTPRNKKGGMYEQFKLVRLPGQPDLDEISRSSPSAQEKFDFQKIQDGY